MSFFRFVQYFFCFFIDFLILEDIVIASNNLVLLIMSAAVFIHKSKKELFKGSGSLNINIEIKEKFTKYIYLQYFHHFRILMMKKMDILGDPGKVTVFANSAGSFCAFCLYVSPQCEVSHILSLTFLAFSFKSLCVASVSALATDISSFT